MVRWKGKEGAYLGPSNSHGLGLITESGEGWDPWAEDSYL